MRDKQKKKEEAAAAKAKGDSKWEGDIEQEEGGATKWRHWDVNILATSVSTSKQCPNDHW